MQVTLIFCSLVLSFIPTLFALKVISTSYGKLRGITDYNDESDVKYIFKRIPFAKPPIGSLRFALPEKPETWTHTLDASRYGPACLSNSSMTSTPQSFISEDCLHLNIFTSEKCLKKQCPVIVYYHGGSFNLDSATMFPDQFILERYVAEGIVFVIPAYRLGVFGQFFLGQSEEEQIHANLFLYDTLLALDYVHDEISNFGGNPKDVTLMGHSSGGNLVCALAFSTKIDQDMKKFQKVIILSSHGLYGFIDIEKHNSVHIAKRLGCNPENRTTTEVLKCMRSIDARDILAMQKEMEEKENLVFKSMLQAPPLMEFNGKIRDLKRNPPPRKMLYGVTEHEFERFQYRDYYVSGKFLDFENPIDTVMVYRENFTNMTSEFVNSDSSSVFVAASTYSQALVNAGGEVYLFECRQKPYTWHVSDMQFFIGIHREKVHTPDMDILDTFYSKMLVNFTKYEEPSPNWKKLNPAKMNYLALEVDTEMGIAPEMKDGFHEELVDFWLINMMEIDRNITIQKQQENGPIPTVNSNEKPASSAPELSPTFSTFSIDQKPYHSLTTTPNSPLTNLLYKDLPIYQQWWFYLIILLAFLTLIFIFILLKRSITTGYESISP